MAESTRPSVPRQTQVIDAPRPPAGPAALARALTPPGLGGDEANPALEGLLSALLDRAGPGYLLAVLSLACEGRGLALLSHELDRLANRLGL